MISPFQYPPVHVCAQVGAYTPEVMVCSGQLDPSRSSEGSGFFLSSCAQRSVSAGTWRELMYSDPCGS